MSSESKIKKWKHFFLKKLQNKDSPKFPKAQKNEELDEELELAQEIFADQEYEKIVKNSDLHDKIKKIILEHGPFTDSEIDHFVEENLNRPVLEEIFNDFKGNEDIKKRHEKIWRDNQTSSHVPPADLLGIFLRQ